MSQRAGKAAAGLSDEELCARARVALVEKKRRAAIMAEKEAASRVKSTLAPAMLSALPALVAWGSIQPEVKYGCAAAVALTALTLVLTLSRKHAAGKLCSYAASFLFFFSLIGAGQEIRRCVTRLCESPTLYGSEQDCRAPCYTPHAEWHWFAVGATLVASAASLFMSVRYNALEVVSS